MTFALPRFGLAQTRDPFLLSDCPLWEWECLSYVDATTIGSRWLLRFCRSTDGEDFCLRKNHSLSFTHPWFRWYLDEIPTWSWCRNGLRLWGSSECLLHMRRLRILKAGCYWLNCVTPEFIWLPWCLSGTESTWQSRRHRRCRFDPWVGKIPWEMKWQTTPVFLPGKFHGQRSLVDHSTWSCKRVRHNWASGQQQKFKHWSLNCGIAEFNHIWRKSP